MPASTTQPATQPASSPATAPASLKLSQSADLSTEQVGPVDRYAVIGNPIGHSKSPAIHAAFAAASAQNLSYVALLAPLDGFAAFTREFFTSGAKGANITVPFKLEALALADELTTRARAAGAVNTLCWRAGKILGDNTDGVGLVRDIVDNAGQSLSGRRVLLLGAGGAARGALLPLLEQNPAQLVIANRTLANAQQLVSQILGQTTLQHPAQSTAQNPMPLQPLLSTLGQSDASVASASILQASEFAALDGQFDLIINATSASLQASLPPLAPGLLGPECLAYDMMYGAKPTVFMQWASSHGARVRDGLGMLVEQAAEAFYVWRGVRPATSAVFANLRAQLS